MRDLPKAILLWTLGCVLFFATLALVACGAGQKAAPAAPSVDEMSFCYAAVLGGVETVGCAETAPACEAARAAAFEAAPEGDAVSDACYPVRLRLERR